MRKTTFVFCTLYLFLTVQISQLLAQTRTISGRVTNGITSKPIEGVQMSVQGSDANTTSNAEGEYSLKIPDTLKTVTFTDFEGMDVMEIKYISNDEINIYLLETNMPDLSIEELMNIKVVTATKNQQTINQAPAMVIVVTAEQIEARKYRSLLDVIQDLPGFVINDFVNSEVRNLISMRGFDDQGKFIILLNGVRISSATGEVSAIMENYPVHFAKQIEVVYGPASALYGADAVAGVINIITKELHKPLKYAVEVSPSVGMYGMMNGSIYSGVKLSDDINFYFSGQTYSEQLAPLEDIVTDKDKFNFQAQQTGTFNSDFGTISPTTSYSKDLEYPIRAYNIYTALKMYDFTISFFSNMSQISTSFPSTGNNAIYNKDVFYKNKISAFNASYVLSLIHI